MGNVTQIQNVQQIDINSFLPLLTSIVDYWYISLPLAIALLLASRWFPKVIIAIVGFFAGTTLVFPVIANIEYVKGLIAGNPTAEIVFTVLTGLVIAAVVFALFKFIFFLGGLLAGFFIGIWLWNIVYPGILTYVVKQYPGFSTPNWLPFAVAGGFAVLIGIMALLSQEKAVSFISILTGSLIFSFFFSYWLSQSFPTLFGTVTRNQTQITSIDFSAIGLLFFVISLVFFVFSGFFASRYRRIQTG